MRLDVLYLGKGKLIVLEGLDGCGKSTQLDLAIDFLKQNNIRSRAVSFPNYDTLSGQLGEKYLQGDIPCEGSNGAYSASSLYAVDRYVSYVTDWKDFYESGGIVITSRYTTSNAIYQLTKLPFEQHDDFLKWLFDFEYVKLGIPKPNAVLYLDMPVSISQKMLDKRYNGDQSKKDIHEKNVEYMTMCRNNALAVAEKYGWVVLDCFDNGFPLPIEDVYAKICDCLKGLVMDV